MTVAEYVPSPLSVTGPIDPVPESSVIVTVAPPMESGTPFASFACTVSTCVDEPSARRFASTGASVDLAAVGVCTV